MNVQINSLSNKESNNTKLSLDNLSILDFLQNKTSKLNNYTNLLEKAIKNPPDLSKRVLIIIPGYSVSNPPRIGHHRYYIDALEYHSEKNPYGYKQIFLFDLYSKKDGRCNFKHDIEQLADELYESITSERDGWDFYQNGEIDFIGASMGGLIVRKFIQKFMFGDNLIKTKMYGLQKICSILLIGTPNFGCKIVNRLQAPGIQLLLRLIYGKNHFAKSTQLRQIAIGETNIFGRLIGKIIKKKTPKNIFLDQLNSTIPTPGNIRWITLHGTKKHWYSSLIYSSKELSDGVILSVSVPLYGAENIADRDFQMDLSWNHRDLYVNSDVSKLLYGLLVLGLKLDDYLSINALAKTYAAILESNNEFGIFSRKTLFNTKQSS